MKKLLILIPLFFLTSCLPNISGSWSLRKMGTKICDDGKCKIIYQVPSYDQNCRTDVFGRLILRGRTEGKFVYYSMQGTQCKNPKNLSEYGEIRLHTNKVMKGDWELYYDWGIGDHLLKLWYKQGKLLILYKVYRVKKIKNRLFIYTFEKMKTNFRTSLLEFRKK